MKYALIALMLLPLAGCVDGKTGKFFICDVTVRCKQ
jgi:hypothetical protein